MDTLFSFLCHQHTARSFWIDGHVLPVCQRCTGLYLGLGLSFVFLLSTRLYKKGFPPPGIGILNVFALLVMPVFGLHLIDPGPAWRLWSGLVFGNAVAFLLLPGLFIIRRKTQTHTPYTIPEQRRLWLFLGFLNTIPLWFPIRHISFYYLSTLLLLLGVAGIGLCLCLLLYHCLFRLSVFLIPKGVHHESPAHPQNPV